MTVSLLFCRMRVCPLPWICSKVWNSERKIKVGERGKGGIWRPLRDCFHLQIQPFYLQKLPKVSRNCCKTLSLQSAKSPPPHLPSSPSLTSYRPTRNCSHKKPFTIRTLPLTCSQLKKTSLSCQDQKKQKRLHIFRDLELFFFKDCCFYELYRNYFNSVKKRKPADPCCRW